jgi:hypothetical protein
MKMTTKKKYLIVILLSTGFALILGTSISYYWIKNVYLKEKIEANQNATLLNKWYTEDSFRPPKDNKIKPEQIQAFIHANQHLAYLLERMQKEFEENSWSIAFEVIKMQPEWQARKFVALQEVHLSPVEYDWIADQVARFWIYRWKEESRQMLNEYGWSFENGNDDEEKVQINYDLLLRYESDLNKIFNLLWPEHQTKKVSARDSSAN